MRVVRIECAQTLNAAANRPQTLAAINPKADHIDLSWVYAAGGVVLGCEGIVGCLLLIPDTSGRFEVHYLFGGYKGPKAAEACVDYAFERLGANSLYGHTPVDNLEARIVNKCLGGEIVGETVDAAGRPCLTYELTRAEWAKRPA